MLTFKVQVEYKIGDPVYLKSEAEQLRYFVTGYYCSEKDVQYEIKSGDYVSYCYGFELSSEEDTNYRINKA